MNHEEAKELVGAYADGELDIAHARDVEEHLRDCGECRSLEQRLQNLRASLREEAPAYRAPAHLRGNIRAAIRREARATDSSGFRSWLMPALAGACALLLLGVFWSQGFRGGGTAMADEVVANHVRSLLATHLVDVESSNQHTVKPWFNGKVDFAPQVKDFAADGFPLVGGRLDYLDGRNAIALVYRHDQHPINVFITPSPQTANSAATTLERRGYNLVHWSSGGLEYWAVSDLNRDDLRRLVTLFGS